MPAFTRACGSGICARNWPCSVVHRRDGLRAVPLIFLKRDKEMRWHGGRPSRKLKAPLVQRIPPPVPGERDLMRPRAPGLVRIKALDQSAKHSSNRSQPCSVPKSLDPFRARARRRARGRTFGCGLRPLCVPVVNPPQRPPHPQRPLSQCSIRQSPKVGEHFWRFR
jgi:hypothetical protein